MATAGEDSTLAGRMKRYARVGAAIRVDGTVETRGAVGIHGDASAAAALVGHVGLAASLECPFVRDVAALQANGATGTAAAAVAGARGVPAVDVNFATGADGY